MDNVIIKEKGFNTLSTIWYGLVMYNIILLSELYFEIYDDLTLNLLLVASILIVIINIASYYSFEYQNKVNKIIIGCIFFWYLVMYINSDPTELLMKFNYLLPYSVLPYCVILLLGLPTINFLRSSINAIYKINILFLFIFFIPLLIRDNGIKQLFLETFAAGAGFIYITNKFHSSRNCFIALIVLVLAFIVATLTARRNLMLTFGLYILIGSIGVIINGKIKSLESKFIAILITLLLLIGGISFYLQESTGTFSLLTERAKENTREEVFLAYAIDMANPKDLILGRGMFGEYYCPGIDKDEEADEFKDYRKDIECGYLQIILKGGIIYLLLYLSIFCLAIYKGLKSSNQLSKSCTCLLLIQLIDMFPFGLHAFNIKTFIIWLAIAICLDVDIRKMKDIEVMNILFKKKLTLLPWKKK